MKSSSCLNCDEAVERNYCSNCGQKTDTYRITLKHFLFHDIVHGVWHMEKGIIFTLKQALLRPGKAALEYIEGKRIRYYNVFYLILLLTGLGIFIESVYNASLLKYISFATPDPVKDSRAIEVLEKYVKFFLLLAIPVYAFNSYILFNKKKLLYSEHLIIFGMYFVGIILITLFQSVIMFTEFVENLAFIADWSNVFISALLLIYIVKGLYDAFGKSYSKIGFSIRTITYIALIFAEIRLLSILILYYLDHYK